MSFLKIIGVVTKEDLDEAKAFISKIGFDLEEELQKHHRTRFEHYALLDSNENNDYEWKSEMKFLTPDNFKTMKINNN
jgi:predicted lactoylglutathione lyase